MIRKIVYAWWWNIFRLCVPALCSFCKKFLSEWAPLCSDCRTVVIPVVSKKIDITPSVSMTVFAISDYKDPIKSLIIAKHWSNIVVAEALGHLLWEMTPTVAREGDVIIPIPLHWTRYAQRGFNQAEEIARVIAHKSKKPLVNLLKRKKKTAIQQSLPSCVRALNVAQAFEVDASAREMYKNKHLILVDDVMTTGATLRAAGKELLRLKPQSITVLVAARVL